MKGGQLDNAVSQADDGGMTEFNQLIDSVADHLRLEREFGHRLIALPDGLMAALSAAGQSDLPVAATNDGIPAADRKSTAAGHTLPHPPRNTAIDADAATALQHVAASVATCRLCPLAEKRNRTVPGQGHARPDVMFIGEAPGADEDQQGLAFVGPAGRLLTRMIEAMGLSRDTVFIANIVKCRPPGNRNPEPAEMEACLPFLKQQIAILKPRVIICLGNVASRGLLASTAGITRLRGRWLKFGAIPVMPTYHPSYLLRFPAAKRQTWEDLKAVLRLLEKPVPSTPGKR